MGSWNKDKRVGQKKSFKLEEWVSELGLDITQYGTHSLRRTKVSLIYEKTKKLRAIQLLQGHSKLQSSIEYLGVEYRRCIMNIRSYRNMTIVIPNFSLRVSENSYSLSRNSELRTF